MGAVLKRQKSRDVEGWGSRSNVLEHRSSFGAEIEVKRAAEFVVEFGTVNGEAGKTKWAASRWGGCLLLLLL